MSRRALLGRGVALSVALVTPGVAVGRAALPWPGGRKGAVSLTYDDGLDSQLDLAVPALDELGLKATFFVTMQNIQHRLTDWAALPAGGHELANHTVSHPCDLRRYSPREFIEREVAPMERWLASIDPGRHDPTYAYPCDVTNLGPGSANAQARRYARLLASTGVVAARTSEGEPNNPARPRRRSYRLQALAVGYDAPDLDAVMRYLSLAERRGHWAILVFHDIKTADLQPGDTGSEMHEGILVRVASSSLWTAPARDVLRHTVGAQY